jgi:rhamnosyl/mannosyltransferase
MRILHFYKTSILDSTGGTEQFIHQLACGLVKEGFKVDVLSLTSKNNVGTRETAGYLSHRARLDFEIASTGFSVSAILRFAELAKKADLIHYHFPWPFMDILHFACRIKKPTLVTYHSDVIRQKYWLKLYRPLKAFFLKSVNRIVVTSPNYIRSSDILVNYKKKINIIPIGLNQKYYPTPSAQKMTFWRARLERKFFLFVGVLRYYKGLHILLEAAKGCDYPIVIVGSGPIEKELKLQAIKLGLNNIHFLGYLLEEDKVALLILCFGVLFPSHLRSEAFGVSLLEGAMYGKPMISSEIGTGTSFINISGQTGLIVPPSDPLALRHAMQYIWEHPKEAEKMGRNAKKRFRKYFTSERMVRSYADLYGQLIKAN